MDFNKGRDALNAQHYDVVITGAGPTGLTAALHAALAGRRTALVERRSSDQDDSQRRFQVVIVDEQTLVNLQNLGMPVDGRFHAINNAHFQTSDEENPVLLPYHRLSATLAGASSGDLDKIAYRRRIVAMASIRDIETGLTELVAANPRIDTFYDETPVDITHGKEGVSVQTSQRTLHGQWLAIADGANSDMKGSLALLGITRRRLGQPVDIAIARYRDSSQAGKLLVRECPDDTYRHTALFGLDNEVVVYTNNDTAAAATADLNEYMLTLADRLRINGSMVEPPLAIRQVTGIVDDIMPFPNVCILGDAAFSGTAILGIYLNKGIFDAVAFGNLLRTGKRSSFRARGRNAAIRELLSEERFIAQVFNPLPGRIIENRLGRELAAAVPRCMFRLKAGRHGLARTVAANVSDTLATLGDGLADSSATPLIRDQSARTARFWRAVTRTLDDARP